MATRIGATIVAAAAVAVITASTPAQADMAAWEKRANAFAAFLPGALPGWRATRRAIHVQNSAFGGRIVEGKRIYRKNKWAGVDSMMIAISNQPNGKPIYTAKYFKDAAAAEKAGYKKITLVGRPALMKTKGRNVDIRIMLKNQVTVSVLGKKFTPKDAEPYLKRMKLKKLGAMNAK